MGQQGFQRRDDRGPGGGLLAVGWVTVLGDRIRDEAVLWTAAEPAGPWREVSLPSTGAGTQRPMAVDCAADHCVVAGSSDEDVVLWRVALTDDGRAVVTETVRRRDSWLERALADLTPAQRALLHDAAELMREVASR